MAQKLNVLKLGEVPQLLWAPGAFHRPDFWIPIAISGDVNTFGGRSNSEGASSCRSVRARRTRDGEISVAAGGVGA